MQGRHTLAILFLSIFNVVALATANADVTVGSLQLISETRISRTYSDFVYKINVSNAGSAVTSVVAKVTSSASATVVIDSDIEFGSIDAGATVTSIDTFSIRQNRAVAFDPKALKFEFSYTSTPPATNHAPELSTIGDQSVAEGGGITVGATASDIDGDSIVLEALELPAFASFKDNGDRTGSLSINPTYTSAGSYTIKLGASDGKASVQTSFNLTVIDVNRPATVSPISAQNVDETKQLVVNVSASDPDGDVISLNVISSTLSKFSVFEDKGDGTGVIRFNPTLLDAGVYDVTVGANDGHVTAATTFSVTVNDVPQAPVVAPVADQLVNENAALEIPISASDLDGDPITLSVDGMPWFGVFEDKHDGAGILNLLPTFADAGTYTIKVIASDGKLIDEESFKLTVINVNRPPSIGAVSTQSVAQGATLKVVVSASDLDGNALTMNASALPAFASSVDNGNGTIEINISPSISDLGTYSLTVSASDGSDVAITSFDLIVTAAIVSAPGLVPGDPAALITDAMPYYEGARKVTDTEISSDPDSGARIIRTAIYISFRPTDTVADVNALLTSINGRILASIAGNPTVSVGIPDPGSLPALNALIETIQSSSAVDGVFLDSIMQPEALPQEPASSNTDSYLDHHLGVRGAAAWNARRAITYAASQPPSFVIYDMFGGGAPASPANQVNWVTNSLSGFNSIGPVDEHGYHVTGIATGNFGGSGTNGEVTGMYPSGDAPVQNLLAGYAVDHTLLKTSQMVAIAQLLHSVGGNIVLNTSMSDLTLKCNTAVNDFVAAEDAKLWLKLIRGAPDFLEERYLHADAAANNACGNANQTNPAVQVAKYHAGWAAAALLPEIFLGEPPLNNTLSVENRLVNPSVVDTSATPNTKTAASSGCTFDGLPGYPYRANASYTGGNISAIGSRADTAQLGVWSYVNTSATSSNSILLAGTPSATPFAGTSMAAPQVAGLATYLWTLRPTLKSSELAERIKKHSRPATKKNCIADTSSTPVIDAYATILSADKDFTDAPARKAILDVVGADGVSDPDTQFTYADFLKYIDEYAQHIAAGTTEFADYSRYDLNGDGYTGGSKLSYFNLDMNLNVNESVYGVVEPKIAVTNEVRSTFDEKALSDLDILCYYAYSPLFPDADRADIQSAFDLVNQHWGTQLSCYVHPEVMVKSGDYDASTSSTFQSFDQKVSVNNSGNIAFTGFNASGNNAGYRQVAPSVLPTKITFTGTSTRLFGGAAINNSDDPELAFNERVSGSPPTYFVRRWKSLGGWTIVGQSSSAASAINGTTFWLDINDQGLVTFLGLTGGSTLNALYAGFDTTSLVKLWTGTSAFAPRPQLSNTNQVIFRNGDNNLVVAQYPTATTSIFVGQIDTDRPGISADGRYMLFPASSGSTSHLCLQRVDSAECRSLLNTSSGDPATEQGQFTAFSPSTRYAVSSVHIHDADTSIDKDKITVVFAATRSYTPIGETVPVTRVGVYRMTVSIHTSDNSLSVVEPPKALVEIGTEFPLSETDKRIIQSFNLWDPLSDNGEFVAFWVSFSDATQAIIRVH